MSNPATLKTLNEAIALMLKSCDSPQPKDPYVHVPWEMANVHAMILHCLKTIYVQSLTVAPTDYRDFTLYCLYWVSVIENHHHIEEDFWFDDMKGAVAKESIVQEHDGFRSQVHDLQVYLESTLPPGTKWGMFKEVVSEASPSDVLQIPKLCTLIDELVAVFVQHFCDEVTYLDPAKLRAALTQKEMVASNKRVLDHIMALPSSFHVFSYLHRPNEHFPPFPWPVKHIILPYILYWADRRIWRFAPKGPNV